MIALQHGLALMSGQWLGGRNLFFSYATLGGHKRLSQALALVFINSGCFAGYLSNSVFLGLGVRPGIYAVGRYCASGVFYGLAR